MKIKQYNLHFAFIDDLIRRRATGTPLQLAKKLDVSDRQVRRIISSLQDDGFPIQYCKNRQSYYYLTPVEIKIRIQVGDKCLLNINGG